LYQTVFVNIWPWWAGGLAIGLFVFLFFKLTGNALGASTGYMNICKLVLPTRNHPFFSKTNPFDWRLFFAAGIVAGGFVSTVLAGDFT